MATSNIHTKLVRLISRQKEQILNSVKKNARLPFHIKVFISIIIWLIIYFILPHSMLIAPIIAAISAFAIVEGATILLYQQFKRNEVNNVSPAIEVAQSIAVTSFPVNKYGVCFLTADKRKKVAIKPYVIVNTKAVSSENIAYLIKIPERAKVILALKYKTTIISTADYELLLIRGSEIKCKTAEVFDQFDRLNIGFMKVTKDIIASLEEDSHAEFEPVTAEILHQIFPTITKTYRYRDLKHSTNNSTTNAETVEQDTTQSENQDITINIQNLEDEVDFEEVFSDTSLSSSNSLEEQTENTESEEESIVVPVDQDVEEIINTSAVEANTANNENNQTLMDESAQFINSVLLQELNYSLDSFVISVKNFYKKAIEHQVKEHYATELDPFLKAVILFYKKNNQPFPFETYDRLKEIIEFKDIELPTSQEMENLIIRITEDLTTKKITMKDELKAYLNKLFGKKSEEHIQNGTVLGLRPRTEEIPVPSGGATDA